MNSIIQTLTQEIQKVFIHHDSRDSDVAQRFIDLFPSPKIQFVSELPFPETNSHMSAEEYDLSKKQIYIKKFKGQFFKQCPGSKPGLVCCNYFILNLGLQCNMNCSYCYLQSYINSSIMTVYSNIHEALEQLEAIATNHPDKPYRVGTGETIDSLSLDPLTGYSETLMSFFKKFPKWTLELKTKSSHVDHLLKDQSLKNVHISWSINPQEVISQEEHGTASLEERLAAAKKCLAHGYKVNFHIDPMIWHENWENNYKNLVDQITSLFQPHQVPHISIGTLRFQPEQRHLMRERFGLQSFVTQAEMFTSRDGKMRYDQALRKKMFETVLKKFKENSPLWRVALCMETPEAWATTIEGSPRKDQKLEELFRPLPKV